MAGNLIEVDEAQWRELQASATSNAAAKKLLDKLGQDPKTRRRTLELLKELNPELSIPEIDAAKPVMDEISKLQAELKADRDAREKEKEEERRAKAESEAAETIGKGRKKLREQGWTKEGIDGVEKLMEERGILDYEAAAALFEKDHPPEKAIEPSNYASGWNLLADDQSTDLIKEAVSLPKGQKQEKALKRWQDNEIRSWFNERNQQRGRVRL